MKKYIVRFNCEFSLAVEALSEQDAIDRALQIPTDDWDQTACSQYDAEEVNQ